MTYIQVWLDCGKDERSVKYFNGANAGHDSAKYVNTHADRYPVAVQYTNGVRLVLYPRTVKHV